MKIAIINDTHCGVRNSSDIFLENSRAFYEGVFFPYLEKHRITKIVHLGDYYDNRKSINTKALTHNKKHFLEHLINNNIEMDITIGNHDTYYKDTNTPNSVKEILEPYSKNIRIIEDPTVVSYGGLDFAFLPWINKNNLESSVEFIKGCTAPVLGGHLELAGFDMQRGIKCDHGMDAGIFDKFRMVLSGHFHTKSSRKNIHYLGSQMEFYWSDSEDPKFFHVLDTETLSLQKIHNPNTLFKKVYYRDGIADGYDFDSLTNHFVRIIVNQKDDPVLFEDFYEKVQKLKLHDLKVVEMHDNIKLDAKDMKIDVEDTIQVISDYVDKSDTAGLDKHCIKNIMLGAYQEAQNLEIV